MIPLCPHVINNPPDRFIAMPDYPILIPSFSFRKPDDKHDVKMLADIDEHGWHVVMVPDDEEGPGFAFTVGVYLRTLRPEILIMGLPIETSHRILNNIAGHLLRGGDLVPDQRYDTFAEGIQMQFKPVHASHFYEYLGCANWFYQSLGKPFPVYQCFWPDQQGRLPDEDGFDEGYRCRQLDLSLPST